MVQGRGGVTCRVAPVGSGVREGAGTLLLSVYVAHKSELTEADELHGHHREDSASEMPTAPAGIERETQVLITRRNMQC